MSAMSVLTRHRLVTTVAGRPVLAFGADTHHGTDQPIGTASVTLPLPLPDHMRGEDDRVLNQPIEIRAGFDDDVIRTIFVGRIDADAMTLDVNNREATLTALGWATLLDWTEEADLIWRGPVALHDIIRSMCRRRGIPAFRIDPITSPGGATIMLGGNPYIDDRQVRIPRRTSPLSWIATKCRLFGYRLFDCPNGEVRVQRVSGIPVAASAATFAEGVNAYRLGRTRALRPMVTYWTVEGPTYTDPDGVQVPVRSIPSSVPPQDMLTPPGYRASRISDSDLTTLAVAEAVRNVHEIDRSVPLREPRWEARGDTLRQPGEVVSLSAPLFGVSGRHWLTSVEHRFEVGELVTYYRGWAGGDTTLPAGDDLITIPIGAGPWHVGDEYLPHYAVPSPVDTMIRLPFTVPDEYTSIAVSGRGHGMNSFLIDGANTDSTVSKIEVWQNGESVGSADLPVMPENLLQRLPYSNDAHWSRFRMPVPGRLEPGAAELRLVSGVDNVGGQDDFEAKSIVLELRGAGQPTLPSQGVS